MTITRIDVDATDTTAARFDALSHPVRLRLLHLIAEHGGSLCVDELTEREGTVTQPVIIYHLNRMHAAGILEREKDGLYTYYSLRPEAFSDMQNELDRLLWQHTQAAAKARRV